MVVIGTMANLDPIVEANREILKKMSTDIYSSVGIRAGAHVLM